jgi:ABC-type antimicrobial peptide transport system ATPase subunit
MVHQGFYQPRRPEKYKGNPTRITYRSSWERQVMVFFDTQSAVLSWQSEELALPYKHPVTGKLHRYFPDFLVVVKTKDGKTKTILIEVKPYAQTLPPVPTATNKATKRYITEVFTYGVNQAKWATARAYCKGKGWEFAIWTEKNLPFI